MKERYLNLMERALSAYSNEHIQAYFERVEAEGLTEHGFPRITANIGILIAHGRRTDLLPMLPKMMDLCCRMFLRPYVKAANEFSVREICCCIRELEEARAVPAEMIAQWKAEISRIVPAECYNSYEKSLANKTRNWAIFMCVSELFRHNMGLCNAEFLYDDHLRYQMQWIDENGMYMDKKGSVYHHPMVYDLVSRGLFCLLLHFGYRGAYYEEIDRALERAGLLTLKMQSTTGEIPFGGRSNQFLHNEPWLATVFEYEALRYARRGDCALATRFKAAAKKAIDTCEAFLSRSPIRHVKNDFPTETGYGCEDYAYFDKYMITVASFLYTAYLLCDDSIEADGQADADAESFATSPYFHKIFLRAGDYCAELDLNADEDYDASGLGRIQRREAPSAICLSAPCPAHPVYRVSDSATPALSICPGTMVDGEWHFATSADAHYELQKLSHTKDTATATVACTHANGEQHKVCYRVDESGIEITQCGNGAISHLLPAFLFDGTSHTEIQADANVLTVCYKGWCYRAETNGKIEKLSRLAQNRNGHYQSYLASGMERLTVKITLERL